MWHKRFFVTGRGQADAILLSVKMLHSPMFAPLVALVLWSFRNVGMPAQVRWKAVEMPTWSSGRDRLACMIKGGDRGEI
jgi:hypothetical protein